MTPKKLYTNALQLERYQDALHKAISPPITFSTHCIKGVSIPLVEPYRADYSRINELEELLTLQTIAEGNIDIYLQQFAPLLAEIKEHKNEMEYWHMVDELIADMPQLEAYFYDDEELEESK